MVVNYASSKSGAENAVVAAIAGAGGKAVAVQGDVSKASGAQGVVDAAIENFGRIDILVNNSGVYELAPIEEVTEEQFHRLFNINVLGLLLTTQAAAKHFGEGASIINIGSPVTRRPALIRQFTRAPKVLSMPSPVSSPANSAPGRSASTRSVPGVVETEGAHSGGFIGSDFENAMVRRRRSAAPVSLAISRPLPSSLPQTTRRG